MIEKSRSTVHPICFSNRLSSLHSTVRLEGSLQHHFNLQLDQQSKEVLLCEFDDPFADYLESMSSIDVKIFLSEEDCLYHLFKPLFCMIWLPFFLGQDLA
jgi:hypothetical protein